jgi:lipopolysaccharide export system permease protein
LKRRLGRLFFVHVLREIVLAVLSVTAVLMLLLVTNQVASVLRRAAEGEIPASLVYELAKLSVGENSVVILPISLLIGILLALGRLYHDSELAAAQACGLGRRQIYGPAVLVAVLAAGVCAWIAFTAGPSAAKRTYEIRTEAMRTALTRGLAAGQFRSLGSGAVLYFRERDEQGLLHEVFFQRPVKTGGERNAPPAGSVEVMLADRASYSLSADGSLYTVILYDGHRHEGVPGQGSWRTLRFAQLTVPLPVPTTTTYRGRADMLTTSQLMADPTPRNLGELHWRIATVCITLLLGVLAVPLSRLRPRQGRYARVGWGVLLYAIYANLLIAGRTLLEQGRVPSWIGLWWVHAVIVVLALAMLWLPKWIHRVRYARLGAAAQPA